MRESGREISKKVLPLFDEYVAREMQRATEISKKWFI